MPLVKRVNLFFFSALEIAGKRNVIEYCMAVGLIANKYDCPRCNLPMRLAERKDVKDGFSWVCRVESGEGKHHVKRSIRCGSWFEESRLDLTVILKMTYLWVKKTGHIWIADELEVSKNTITDWMNYCREVCVYAVLRESVMIGGPGTTVEIGGCEFNRSKLRGKRVNGGWVFWGVERGSNKFFAEVVGNRSKTFLLNVVEKCVRPETTVISDCWEEYDCLEDEGFVLLSVKQGMTFKDPSTGAHTDTIKATVKRSLRGSLTNEDTFAYISEFMWRLMHQDNVPAMYEDFLSSIKYLYPPAFSDEVVESQGEKRSLED